MTVRLSETSPHLVHAARFGAELTRAMEARGVGQGVVRDAAGVSRASIVEFRHGRNLPTLPVARRLAEALGAPKLEAIVREARTRHCEVDGRAFIQDTGRPRRYCSIACRRIGAAGGNPDGTADGLGLLRSEMLRVGPIPKQAIGKAITLLEDAKAPDIAARASLALHQDAVAAMCAGCEPEGYCRTVECALRSISPLPMAGADPQVVRATKAPGRWGHEGAREAHSADMHERHAARPEWAAATSARTKARWDAMTPEERVDAGRLISERRRASA